MLGREVLLFFLAPAIKAHEAMKRSSLNAIGWALLLAVVSVMILAVDFFPEGNEPKPGDTATRAAKKINNLLYAAAPSSLDFFPEGTEPKPGDDLRRSLIKANALLYNSLVLSGGAISANVSDTAYDATSWNGVTAIAPSKNSVRDKIESLAATIPETIWTTNVDGTIQATSSAADGASAVALSLNTSNALTTSGAKLMSLYNQGTNRLNVNHTGGLFPFANSMSSWGADDGPAMVAIRRLDLGDLNYNELSLGVQGTNDTVSLGEGFWDAYMDVSSVNLSWGTRAADGFGTLSQHVSIISNGDVNEYIDVAGSQRYVVNPSAGDGATPYLFDTSVAHTSGSLARLNNKGTNVYDFQYNAQLILTSPNNLGGGVAALLSDGGFMDLYAGSGIDVSGPGGVGEIDLYPGNSDGNAVLKVNSTDAHTFGDFVKIQNSGTDVFVVTPTSGIKTSIPTGGTNAVPFKIGEHVAGTFTIVSTNCLLMEVAGVTYKIATFGTVP